MRTTFGNTCENLNQPFPNESLNSATTTSKAHPSRNGTSSPNKLDIWS